MTMAAVRHAGRRLVGGRRSEALSWFWPRSTSAGSVRPKFIQSLGPHHQSEKVRLLMELQEKKEKLYRLIDELSVIADGKIGFSNFDLLPHLSAQINPRPNDPVWRFIQKEYKFYIFWMIFSPPITAYGIWVFFRERAKKRRIRREQEFLI